MVPEPASLLRRPNRTLRRGDEALLEFQRVNQELQQLVEEQKLTINMCIHSGNCVRGLPLVFDVKRKHWVRPELATAAEVAAQIGRCPSGALQYILKKDGGAA